MITVRDLRQAKPQNPMWKINWGKKGLGGVAQVLEQGGGFGDLCSPATPISSLGPVEMSTSTLPCSFICPMSQAPAVFVQIRVRLLCKLHMSFPRHWAAAPLTSPAGPLFALYVVGKQSALSKPPRALRCPAWSSRHAGGAPAVLNRLSSSQPGDLTAWQHSTPWHAGCVLLWHRAAWGLHSPPLSRIKREARSAHP
jgi:hypothetical protein